MSATFDHRVAGTTAAAWTAAGLDRSPLLNQCLAAEVGHLVVLAAHPDDETLGAGGLIAVCAGLGAKITVVIASDGEHSHPGSTTHTPAQLAAIRRDESAAAVRQLAPDATVGHLGLPDGNLAAYADTLDVALGAFLDAPDAPDGPLRLVTPWRGDGHPDHLACASVAERQVRTRHAELAHGTPGRPIEHWEYPIWAWHWGDPAGDDLPWRRLRRVELSVDDLAAKRRAVTEYVSQHAPLSPDAGDEPVLSGELLEHFDRPYECFVVPAPATRPAYFEALYAKADDPWGLGKGFYESRKRDLLLASLPRPRFRRAFEPGCATGLLTERLAQRCDELLSWDVAEAALRQARARLANGDGASPIFARGYVPQDWPDGTFDLIVLSEVGYYCADLAELRDRVLASLTDDGVVVACHWRHVAEDYPHGAEDVHSVFGEVLQRDVHHVEDDFLLDVWSRNAVSVAVADGVL